MSITELNSKIRPANMRVSHGINSDMGPYSVAASRFTEEYLLDHFGTAASGSGMDAPEELPVGSVKAFFDPSRQTGTYLCFGFWQRTIPRYHVISSRRASDAHKIIAKFTYITQRE